MSINAYQPDDDDADFGSWGDDDLAEIAAMIQAERDARRPDVHVVQPPDRPSRDPEKARLVADQVRAAFAATGRSDSFTL